MATRSTGIKIGFRLGDLPLVVDTDFWSAWHETWVANWKYAFGHVCNLQFVGSKRPNIFITTRYDPSNWAVSTLRGWGYGTIAFSNHPAVIALWKKYGVKKIATSLFAHEGFHVLGYTFSKAGTWPTTLAMASRLAGHYGDPVPGIDRMAWELRPEGALRWQDKWLDRLARLRGMVSVVPIGSLDIEKGSA